MKKKLIAVILAVAVALSLAACGSSSDNGGASESDGAATTVKIGYLPITHALAVAEEKDLLESEGSDVQIELQKFSSWSDLTDALNAGKIDGASVLAELAMSAKNQGIDIKAVALGHKDGNVIVVNKEINSAADMKGKTFAIPHTQSSHNILLQDALAEANLTVDDVEVVQMAPTEMPASLSSGAIDGYCVAEPFGAQAVEGDMGKVLYSSEELWEDSVCCAFVLNNSFIEANPEAAETIIAKYNEAGAALESGDEALSEAKAYLGQDENVLKTSLKWIHFDDLAITEKEYDSLADKVKEYGISEETPSYSDFVYQQ